MNETRRISQRMSGESMKEFAELPCSETKVFCADKCFNAQRLYFQALNQGDNRVHSAQNKIYFV